MVLEPFHFDAQVAHQPLLVNAQYDSSGKVSDPAMMKDLPRVCKLLGRVAFRAESDKNYFELGYQADQEFNALKALGSCQPLATPTLTSCLQALQTTAGPAQFPSANGSVARAQRRVQPCGLEYTYNPGEVIAAVTGFF
jgi:hypothetical protein